VWSYMVVLLNAMGSLSISTTVAQAIHTPFSLIRERCWPEGVLAKGWSRVIPILLLFMGLWVPAVLLRRSLAILRGASSAHPAGEGRVDSGEHDVG
jgi:hypothetical protein